MVENLNLPVGLDSWRLVTDGVMGGISQGRLLEDTREQQTCLSLTGQVSTENNGGFIQAARDISPELASQVGNYSGIEIEVLGNGEPYNLHLRTSYLWLPWQSYRASFTTNGEWQRVKLPFDSFEPYKTRSRLQPNKLRRVGVLAIGREFAADLCIRSVAFYRG